MTQPQHDHIEHGKQFDHVPKDCPTCDGTGEVYLSECCGNIVDFKFNKAFCTVCFKGCEFITDKCDTCKGHGIVMD